MLKTKIHTTIYRYGVPMLLFLIPFNNILCNILILVLAANWLLEGGMKEKLRNLIHSPYILLCLAWFALIYIESFYAVNTKLAHFGVEKKMSLVCFPLVIASTPFFARNDLRLSAYRFFAFGTTLGAIILLGIALYKYVKLHTTQQFFYHDLTDPFHQHAVYYSVYAYISMTYFYYFHKTASYKWLMVLSMIFLFGFILLLSSKLIILFLLVHALSIVVLQAVRRSSIQFAVLGFSALALITFLVLFTDNPIRKRFVELDRRQTDFLKQDKFTEYDNFNGLQFRLLLWKYSYNILEEKNAWLFGVTPGDSQDLIDEKILQHHLYTGRNTEEDFGYLHHNCHNQYIETLLQNGCVGLLLLLFIIGISIHRLVRDRTSPIYLFSIFIFCYFFLTEAPLERMFGIVPFFILLSLFNTARRSNNPTGSQDTTSNLKQ